MNHFMKLSLLSLVALVSAVRASIDINGLDRNSDCILSSQVQTVGTVDCTLGDILLIGRYLSVGVHNVASLGMQTPVTSSYYNGLLSLLSDFDKNGWTSSPSPSYAGDFFSPGSPIEGWSLEYTSDDSGNVYLPNQGNNDLVSLTPTLFEVTSNGSLLSAIWVGKNELVEIRKVIQFEESSLYLSFSVSIKNIGSSILKDFYYERTGDPDQGTAYQSDEDKYSTMNYVKYQPATTGYENEANKYSSLVCAAANYDLDLFVSLGAVNSRSHVEHTQMPCIYGPSMTIADDRWKNYGGNTTTNTWSDAKRMNFGDARLILLFYFDSIEPGETVSFEYFYSTTFVDSTKALAHMTSAYFMQPVDALSGSHSQIVAAVQVQQGTALKACSFSVFAAKDGGTAQWHHIASNIVPIANSFTMTSATYTICATSFDSTAMKDGPVQVKLDAILSDGSSTTINKAFSIENSGMTSSFSVASNVTKPISVPLNNYIEVSLTSVDSNQYSFVSSMYFIECLLDNEVQSKFVGTYFTGSSSVQISTSNFDLTTGDFMFVRAVTTSASLSSGQSYTTTSTLTVLIEDPLYLPPQDIFLSYDRVMENASVGSIIGDFTSVGGGKVGGSSSGVVYSYSLVDSYNSRVVLGNNASYFLNNADDDTLKHQEWNASSLVVAQPLDYSITNGYFEIQVKSEIVGQTEALNYLVKTFRVFITNCNVYKCVTPSTLSIAENLPINSLVGQVTVADPHITDIPFYYIPKFSDEQLFSVDGDTGVVTSLQEFDFEAQSEYIVRMEVYNNYEELHCGMNITIAVLDVNEAPTGIACTCVTPSFTGSSGGGLSKAGNCSMWSSFTVGDTIAVLSTVDEDENDSHTYSMSSCTVSNLLHLSPDGTLILQSSVTSLGSTLVSCLFTTTDSGGLQFSERLSFGILTATISPTVAPTTLSPTMKPSQLPTKSPTAPPSVKPSTHPSTVPSLAPTRIPTICPSLTPSLLPSESPSLSPSIHPTLSPTVPPTIHPSLGPSIKPTKTPTLNPSILPTIPPSLIPSESPSFDPSHHPSEMPSEMPSETPSTPPTSRPTGSPSVQPTSQPSDAPSHQPSHAPSDQPTDRPTECPSSHPTSQPSSRPTVIPSSHTSALSTVAPSLAPYDEPTQPPVLAFRPSLPPSAVFPSSVPTALITSNPSPLSPSWMSVFPSESPSEQPSQGVTASTVPALQPTSHPTALISDPLSVPTCVPSSHSTFEATNSTITPSSMPSVQPSVNSSLVPAFNVTVPLPFPTSRPTSRPTTQSSTVLSPTQWREPTSSPSEKATMNDFPSSEPTQLPSSAWNLSSTVPSSRPPLLPTLLSPTSTPSQSNDTSLHDDTTPYPTGVPSFQPTSDPTSSLPSATPSTIVDVGLSTYPSQEPSLPPLTGSPLSIPSPGPTQSNPPQPSCAPSTSPSVVSHEFNVTQGPSELPSLTPSIYPSMKPSISPSIESSQRPSRLSSSPTAALSPTGSTTLVRPTTTPTIIPSPSTIPSTTAPSPSYQPTLKPSSTPSPTLRVTPSPSAVSLPILIPPTVITFSPNLERPTSPPSLPAPSLSPSDSPTVSVLRLNDMHCTSEEDQPVNSYAKMATNSSTCNLQSYGFESPSTVFSLINVTALSYNGSIASSEAFRLDSGCNGAVLVNQSSLFITEGDKYTLWFEVIENGVMIATGRVLMQLINTNQPPVFKYGETALLDQVLTTLAVREDATPGTSIGFPFLELVTDLDDLAPNATDYAFCCNKTFDLVNDNSTFQIDTISGQLSLLSNLSYDSVSTYLVVVRVTDGGGLSSEALVEIKVIRVPVSPILSHLLNDNMSFAVIEEGALRNSIVGNNAIFILNKMSGFSYTVAIVADNSRAFKLQYEPVIDGYALLVNNSVALKEAFSDSKFHTITIAVSVDGYDRLNTRANYTLEMNSAQGSLTASTDLLTAEDCTNNTFFVNGSCQSCFWAKAVDCLAIGLALAFVGCLWCGWIQPTLTSVMIVVDHTQTLALYGIIRGFAGSSTAAGVLNGLTVFNLNPDLLFNSCWLNISPRSSSLFELVSVLPLLMLVVVIALATLNRTMLRRLFPRIAAVTIAQTDLLLINALSVFSSNGADFSGRLKLAGGVQFVTYYIVVPVMLLWLLWRRKTKSSLFDMSRLVLYYIPSQQHWLIIQLLIRGALVLLCSVSGLKADTLLVCMITCLVVKHTYSMQHRPYHKLAMHVKLAVDMADDTVADLFTVENPLMKGRVTAVTKKEPLREVLAQQEENQSVVYRRYGYNEIEQLLIFFQLLTGLSLICMQDDTPQTLPYYLSLLVLYSSLTLSLLLCVYVLCLRVKASTTNSNSSSSSGKTTTFDIEQGMSSEIQQRQAESDAQDNTDHVVAFDEIARDHAAIRRPLFSIFKLSTNRTALVDGESRLDYNALYGDKNEGEKDTARLLVDPNRKKKSGIINSLLSVVSSATPPTDGDDNLTENPLRDSANGGDGITAEKKQVQKKQKKRQSKKKSSKRSVLSIFSRTDSGLGSSLLSGSSRSDSGSHPGDKKRIRTINIFRALRRTNYRKSINDTYVYDANQEPIQFTSNPVMKMLQQRKAAITEDDGSDVQSAVKEEEEKEESSNDIGEVIQSANQPQVVEEPVIPPVLIPKELEMELKALLKSEVLCFDADF